MKPSPDTRVCRICGAEKPITAFHKTGNHRRTECGVCRTAQRHAALHSAHELLFPDTSGRPLPPPVMEVAACPEMAKYFNW